MNKVLISFIHFLCILHVFMKIHKKIVLNECLQKWSSFNSLDCFTLFGSCVKCFVLDRNAMQIRLNAVKLVNEQLKADHFSFIFHFYDIEIDSMFASLGNSACGTKWDNLLFISSNMRDQKTWQGFVVFWTESFSHSISFWLKKLKIKIRRKHFEYK